MASQLKKVFNDIDDDQSGLITLDELEEHLDDENMQLIFTSLDIAPDDAWTLFKLLDADGSHEIGLDEFIDGSIVRENAPFDWERLGPLQDRKTQQP